MTPEAGAEALGRFDEKEPVENTPEDSQLFLDEVEHKQLAAMRKEHDRILHLQRQHVRTQVILGC